MSGTFEGTARGVPMLFIPIFGDQLRNALKSVATGNAVIYPFTSLSEKSLSETLEKMLINKDYFDRAKELARTFNDNLVHPMDEAIFWIEYVIRSNGAKHLKSNAVKMPLYSYLLLDIILPPIIVILILYLIVKKLLCTQKSDDKQKSKKTTNKKKNK